MTFSDRVKYIRGNIRQKDFAERLDVSLGAVQHWEIDNQIPRGDILIRIRDRFNVDLNWLLTGEGNPLLNHPTTYSLDGTSSAVVKEVDGEYRGSAIVLQHMELVKQFCDRETAKLANMELLNIERIDGQAFREVVAYIKGISNGLRMAEKRAGADQAVSNESDDRRTGPDRRNAGGQ